MINTAKLNILITGANGYIGQRLVESLLGKGHRLFCCVRNRSRYEAQHAGPEITILEFDFFNPGEAELPIELDVAFYLIHSLALESGNFADQELGCANNFNQLLKPTGVRQVIYLGGKEMKLPGEAWPEFNIREVDGQYFLNQVATFRPRGLWGRLYWYVVLPFHYFIFNGMADKLAGDKK